MFSLQVKVLSFTQQHLLKTPKSIRELYSAETNADHKVREYVSAPC